MRSPRAAAKTVLPMLESFRVLHGDAASSPRDHPGHSPKVSVVVPAYNVAAFIGPALDSVLEQSLREIEVLVVDDGSTDGTLDVIRGIHDSRMKVLENSHRGVAAALNAGVAASRGEFIAFLDGDDLWHREKLARQVAVIGDRDEFDLAFCWTRLIDERGEDIGLAITEGARSVSFAELLTDYSIANNSTVMVRRNVFPEGAWFQTEYVPCHDMDAWLRVARLRPGNTVCVHDYLTYYRRRPDQFTSDVALIEQAWSRVLAHFGDIAPGETSPLAATARCNMFRFFAYLSYEQGRLGQAVQYGWRGFRSAPTSFLFGLRNWGMLAGLAAAWLLPAAWCQRLVKKLGRRRRAATAG